VRKPVHAAASSGRRRRGRLGRPWRAAVRAARLPNRAGGSTVVPGAGRVPRWSTVRRSGAPWSPPRRRRGPSPKAPTPRGLAPVDPARGFRAARFVRVDRRTYTATGPSGRRPRCSRRPSRESSRGSSLWGLPRRSPIPRGAFRSRPARQSPNERDRFPGKVRPTVHLGLPVRDEPRPAHHRPKNATPGRAGPPATTAPKRSGSPRPMRLQRLARSWLT
jgi:hypothetical protein